MEPTEHSRFRGNHHRFGAGGSLPLTYGLSPTVPGLSFGASTRTLSGAPTAAGSYRVTCTVTDASSAGAGAQYAAAERGEQISRLREL